MFVTSTIIAFVTAYNLISTQTDSSPCIGATGENLCIALSFGEKICASNDYKMGTWLSVPGYGICRIADRMNRRYTGTGRIDVAFPADETREARKWGVKKLKVTRL